MIKDSNKVKIESKDGISKIFIDGVQIKCIQSFQVKASVDSVLPTILLEFLTDELSCNKLQPNGEESAS